MVSASTVTTLAVIAIPHVLYAFIWFFPKKYTRVCKTFTKTDALTVFANVAVLMKVLQFSAVYLWYTASGPLSMMGKSPAIWAASIAMVAFGQALNAGIYNAIGKNGVYYGFKLGKKVPWVTGFPFNVVRHPQYVGAVLTVWGVLLFVADGNHPDTAALAAGWTLIYIITGIQEDFTKGG